MYQPCRKSSISNIYKQNLLKIIYKSMIYSLLIANTGNPYTTGAAPTK